MGMFYDLCFLCSLTGGVVSLNTHNVEVKGQCQIVIYKAGDKFSQEPFAFFFRLCLAVTGDLSHSRSVLDAHILCS